MRLVLIFASLLLAGFIAPERAAGELSERDNIWFTCVFAATNADSKCEDLKAAVRSGDNRKVEEYKTAFQQAITRLADRCFKPYNCAEAHQASVNGTVPADAMKSYRRQTYYMLEICGYTNKTGLWRNFP